MSIPLKQGSNGNFSRLSTTDKLDAAGLEPRVTTVDLIIGSALSGGSAKVILGNATHDAEVLKDLILSAGSLVGGTGVGSIGASITNYFTSVWLAKAGATPANAAYGLNVTGTDAGAYAVGVDPSLISSSAATDLMNMLDDMDAAIGSAGTTTETLAIEDTVTIAAGDVVAGSLSATGRVTLANAQTGGGQNPNFIGVCVSVTGGGVGNPGGTTTATFTKPGNKTTVSGASFTVGGPLYMPEGGSTPSIPTQTAPTDVGDIVQRIGWALSATEFIVSDLVGLSL